MAEEITLETVVAQLDDIIDRLSYLPSIELLQRQFDRQITAFHEMRDDARVTSAIITRIDATLSGLVQEIRATHGQVDRLRGRIGKLEDRLDSVPVPSDQ